MFRPQAQLAKLLELHVPHDNKLWKNHRHKQNDLATGLELYALHLRTVVFWNRNT